MTRDLPRRIWVTASAALCIYGTLLGFGVIGTPVEDSAGGALSADATVLAPGSTAFSIWSVIYLGLLAYTVWQWLPSNRTSERARATGWLAGVSMLLNAAWILVTQAGMIWVSVFVIAALALVLGFIVRRLTEIPASGLADRVALDGTFGAYLGWVTVATCANIAAAGDASGWSSGEAVDQVIAVVVLAVAAGLGVYFAHRLGGRWSLALALAWGLAWIGIARLTDTPESTLVGISALAAAAVVLAGTFLFRNRTAEVR